MMGEEGERGRDGRGEVRTYIETYSTNTAYKQYMHIRTYICTSFESIFAKVTVCDQYVYVRMCVCACVPASVRP